MSSAVSPSPLLLAAVLLLTLAACGAPPGRSDAPAAASRRTVILGGTILTGDPAQPRVEGLVIEGDRIVLAGSREAAEAYAEDAAEVITLDEGAAVTPGLIDAHFHLEGVGNREVRLRLTGTGSIGEIQARLRERVASSPGDGWIQGRGWDQNDWLVQAWPSAADLDVVAPDRPVALERVDGHALWVNGAALRVAGIGPETPDPPGGRILRDEAGEPTGILIDTAAGLVGRAIPDPARDDRRAAVLAGGLASARAGLTMIHDMGVDAELVGIYRELAEAGELPIRVYAYVGGTGDLLDAYLERGPEVGDWFTVRGVKLYVDGAMGSRGAALLDDYADEPGTRGLVIDGPETIEEVARRCLEAGLQVATHAIGDRGNRIVLDAYERALAAVPAARDPRLRIEHAQHVRPEDLPRFAAAGIIASMQPTHCTSDAPWVGDRLGPDRLEGSYAWRSLADTGAILAFGSDAPVESERPVLGLEAAVRRADPHGTWDDPFLPHEALSVEEALAAFTRGAAYASFDETRLGMLRPGFAADLVLWPHDPTTVPPEDLDTLTPTRVIIGGRSVPMNGPPGTM